MLLRVVLLMAVGVLFVVLAAVLSVPTWLRVVFVLVALGYLGAAVRGLLVACRREGIRARAGAGGQSQSTMSQPPQ